MVILFKLLLENLEFYDDVVIYGIWIILGLFFNEFIVLEKVSMVKMGIIVVINVLLE